MVSISCFLTLKLHQAIQAGTVRSQKFAVDLVHKDPVLATLLALLDGMAGTRKSNILRNTIALLCLKTVKCSNDV